jgi:hypothetical protein
MHRRAIIRLGVINHFRVFLISLLSLSSDTVNVQNADCPDMDMDRVRLLLMGGGKMWLLNMTVRCTCLKERGELYT